MTDTDRKSSRLGASGDDRLLEALDDRCTLLTRHPHLDRARPDSAPNRHDFPVGNYWVLRRLLPDGIELVRVAPGARRLDSLM